MILSNEDKEHMEEVFKAVDALNEDAKALKASANDALKSLADLLDKEKTKETKKNMKKGVARAFKDWLAKQKQEDKHIEIADELTASLSTGEEL